MASLMTNLFFLYGIYVLTIGQTALSSQSSRHCYVRRHKRSARPTYRYRPHVSDCASSSSTISVMDDGCEEPQRPLLDPQPAFPTTKISKPSSPPWPTTVGSESPSVTEILKRPPSTTTDSNSPTTTEISKKSLSPPPPPSVYGLHKHLLLITGQVYHEYIGECSIAAQARDLQDLGSMLPVTGVGDFVLVQVGTGWRLNVRLLDVLIDQLGNVSVYADKKYYSKTMTKHCRNIGPRCTLLASLVPVLEQFESGAVAQSASEAGDGDRMYDPDWIPVPALPPLPRNFTGNTEKQIEYLTWRLCVRDRRRNFYYKIDKDSPLSTLRYTRKHQLFLALRNLLPFP